MQSLYEIDWNGSRDFVPWRCHNCAFAFLWLATFHPRVQSIVSLEFLTLPMNYVSCLIIRPIMPHPHITYSRLKNVSCRFGWFSCLRSYQRDHASRMKAEEAWQNGITGKRQYHPVSCMHMVYGRTAKQISSVCRNTRSFACAREFHEWFEMHVRLGL